MTVIVLLRKLLCFPSHHSRPGYRCCWMALGCQQEGADGETMNLGREVEEQKRLHPQDLTLQYHLGVGALWGTEDEVKQLCIWDVSLVVMLRAMNWEVGKDALIQNIADNYSQWPIMDNKYLPTPLANLICNFLHVFYLSVLIFTHCKQLSHHYHLLTIVSSIADVNIF